MKIRLIGLGKMGLNIAQNLNDNKHEVIGYAPSQKTRDLAKQVGITTVDELEGLFNGSKQEKVVVWLLVPNKVVDSVLEEVLPFLKAGDIVVDGGNSNFNLSIKRYEKLKEQKISFVDVGTSGGTNGARNGACLMVGGDKESFEYLEKVYKDISAKNGFEYMGSPGAGHFVKMVHNGIEYGMMQAIGEGFELLEKSKFDLDFQKIASVWNHGSIIESALIKNIHDAFAEDTNLEEVAGRVDDSGEGMWMIEEALKHQVSMPVIGASLFTRYKSRDELKFAEKVVSAMRGQFGGHKVYSSKKQD